MFDPVLSRTDDRGQKLTLHPLHPPQHSKRPQRQKAKRNWSVRGSNPRPWRIKQKLLAPRSNQLCDAVSELLCEGVVVGELTS
jgi:hypothetical protein